MGNLRFFIVNFCTLLSVQHKLLFQCSSIYSIRYFRTKKYGCSDDNHTMKLMFQYCNMKQVSWSLWQINEYCANLDWNRIWVGEFSVNVLGILKTLADKVLVGIIRSQYLSFNTWFWCQHTLDAIIWTLLVNYTPIVKMMTDFTDWSVL